MKQMVARFAENSARPEISIVVPLYNEEENISELYHRLTRSLEALEVPYELVFVNDGSQDTTLAQIAGFQQADPRVVAIDLSRNFGHQAAICAGIDHARGRAVVLMDGDLQDPPEVLPEFIDAWRKGNEVVYAIRRNRKEGLLKRMGYFLFYRLLRAISDLDIPLDSGDFCLMDRKVVDALKELPERGRFVRGLRTFVGFRQVGVAYNRASRNAGEPKYTFRALLGLAADGLISFSNYPLRLATYLGLVSVVVSMVVGIWVIADAFSNKSAPQGWASTIVIVLFMGAIQLLTLGIMGEYMRRIFLEAKRRPTYIVKRVQSQEACLPLSTPAEAGNPGWKSPDVPQRNVA
jgi:dolichol-phosphate mannosyltransferase